MVDFNSLADSEEHVNALFFGEAGSGKTTAAAHLAKLGNVVVINCEAGVKKRPLMELGVPVERIKTAYVSNYAEADEVYWKIKASLDKKPDSIVGVVIDSYTDLQKKLTDSVVEQRVAKHASTMEVDEFEIELKDHGKVTEMSRRLARRFRDLPCHVAFVCLSKRDLDGDGTVVIRPDLTPKFAADMMGYVDVACYTLLDAAGRHIAITLPIGKYRGKDRYGALPHVMFNPTFDRVARYINEPEFFGADKEQVDYEKSDSSFKL